MPVSLGPIDEMTVSYLSLLQSIRYSHPAMQETTTLDEGICPGEALVKIILRRVTSPFVITFLKLSCHCCLGYGIIASQRAHQSLCALEFDIRMESWYVSTQLRQAKLIKRAAR